MSNLFRVLFLLSLTSFITCKQEIRLNCDGNNSPNPLGNFKTCFVGGFEVTENETKFIFDHNNDLDYTGVVMTESTFNVFPTQIFDLFPNVQFLDVFSRMTKIEDHTFRNASQLTYLLLEYNRLTEITEFTFDGAFNLVDLRLNGNRITNVHPKAFHLCTKLESILMRFNKITSVDKNMFAPLKNLKELDLSHNKISKIDSKLVSHNDKLELLNLGFNKFDTLEIELSTKLLKVLDIHGFDLKLRKLTLSKSPDTTDDVTVIEMFDVRFSNVSSFDNLSFHVKIQVKHLELGYNKITSLVDAPTFLPYITKLELSSNKIVEISPEFVAKLENIEILKLSKNPIKTSVNMFEPLKRLKKLALEQINLSALEPELFTGLTKLEYLNCIGNNVKRFDYMALMSTLPALKVLEIQGNDFTCSYLQQMVADLKSIGRIEVLAVRESEYLEEVNEVGNEIYGIQCEKHAMD